MDYKKRRKIKKGKSRDIINPYTLQETKIKDSTVLPSKNLKPIK